jgi:membrane protein YdbS with pleckstrin-like domain
MQNQPRNKDKQTDMADLCFTAFFLILSIGAGGYLIYKTGDIWDTYSLLALIMMIATVGLSIMFILRIRASFRRRKLNVNGQHKTHETRLKREV